MSSLELFILIAGIFWCCIVPFCILVGYAPELRELLEDIICERRER